MKKVLKNALVLGAVILLGACSVSDQLANDLEGTWDGTAGSFTFSGDSLTWGGATFNRHNDPSTVADADGNDFLVYSGMIESDTVYYAFRADGDRLLWLVPESVGELEGSRSAHVANRRQ